VSAHAAEDDRPRHAVSRKLRNAVFGDAATSLSRRARSRRWQSLLQCFPDVPDMRVIDLGGAAWAWWGLHRGPKSVLVVNTDVRCIGDGGGAIEGLQADVCELPSDFAGHDFDLVFSNSVIEHVGGPWRRKRFADAVHRLAPHHWVQTPSRSFPVEPHWLFPGFQLLPVAARARLSQHWPLAPDELRAGTFDDAIANVLDVELVSAAEMRVLFPQSRLHKERFAGLTKSIVAVR